MNIFVATFECERVINYPTIENEYFKSENDAKDWLRDMFIEYQEEKAEAILSCFSDDRSSVPDPFVSMYDSKYNELKAKFTNLIAFWSTQSYDTIINSHYAFIDYDKGLVPFKCNMELEEVTVN